MRAPYPVAALAGLSLLGALGGCAGPGVATPATPSATGPYEDGTYGATGSYQSPNGTETIDVELTIESDVITDVEVTTHPTNPNTEQFQGQFAGGIADLIVGKKLDEISVSRVAGSSLTSGGFNSALEEIKAEAAQ